MTQKIRTKLPVMLQSEIAECGLVCILMVTRFYGYNLSLTSLRERFPSSLAGTSISQLSHIARELEFDAQIKRAPAESIGSFYTPCIAFWGENHFIVISKMGQKSVIIHDPAKGRLKLTLDEFKSGYSGVLLLLEPQQIPSERVEGPRFRNFGRILRIIRPHLRSSFSVLGLCAIVELLSLISPFFLQWSIDKAIKPIKLDLLTTLAIAFISSAVIRGALLIIRDWSLASLNASFVRHWGDEVFRHLINLPLPFFEKRTTGDILSRYTSIQNVQSILSSNLVTSFIDGTVSIIALALIASYSWIFFDAVLFTLIFYTALRMGVYHTLVAANREQITASANQQTAMIEAVRGIATLKLFNFQNHQANKFLALFTKTLNKMVRVKFLSSAARSLAEVSFALCRIIIVIIAGRKIISNQMTVGEMVAALAFVEMFLQKAGAVVDNLIEVRVLELHLERVEDITSHSIEITGPCNTITCPESITFENVSFRYSEAEPWILRSFSMNVRNGEAVAITGPSGSGKSTLISLLVGFINPTEGRILIDGRELSEIGLSSFRRICGTVLQSDRLFSGTLIENISFFDDVPDIGRVLEACDFAGIKSEILSFPMGLQTLVGDMGSALSVGQAQRVLLARAIYRKPYLLILDEATSNLDVAKEREISENMSDMKITRIFVAHRPDAVSVADRVVDLTKRSNHSILHHASSIS